MSGSSAIATKHKESNYDKGNEAYEGREAPVHGGTAVQDGGCCSAPADGRAGGSCRRILCCYHSSHGLAAEEVREAVSRGLQPRGQDEVPDHPRSALHLRMVEGRYRSYGRRDLSARS